MLPVTTNLKCEIKHTSKYRSVLHVRGVRPPEHPVPVGPDLLVHPGSEGVLGLVVEQVPVRQLVITSADAGWPDAPEVAGAVPVRHDSDPGTGVVWGSPQVDWPVRSIFVVDNDLNIYVSRGGILGQQKYLPCAQPPT